MKYVCSMPFVSCRLLLIVSAVFWLSACQVTGVQTSENIHHKMQKKDSHLLKLAMLHLELQYADLEHNAQLIENGIRQAAANGAQWVMTPELSYTGYRFDLKIGTHWIVEGPDQYVKRVQKLADELNVTVFLSHLERGSNTTIDEIYNTLFVINDGGEIIGRHRKINTIPVSEEWSTAGVSPTIVQVDGYRVGLLICADAWPQSHAKALYDAGANILLSSASWAPGLYGPGDTWEKRSFETKLPLFVNNRTGIEREFDLSKATSVVVNNGERLVTHMSNQSTLLLIDWDHRDQKVIKKSIIALEK